MGTVSHFLEIKFQWMVHDDGNLDTYLSQKAYAYHLIQTKELSQDNTVERRYHLYRTVNYIPY